MRRRIAPLVLALALSLPAHAFAADAPSPPDSGAPPGDTVVGALLAVVCGASLNVARVFPHPFVIATAVGSCLGAVIDAISTSD